MIRTGFDHLLGAHRYLAAPVQRGGEPPAELGVPLNSPSMMAAGDQGFVTGT
jgi:hypothetical protein